MAKEKCMKHKVRINVSNRNGDVSHVVTSRRKRIPALLSRILFGGFGEVVILTPGKTVEGIEIREVSDEN